MPRKIAIIGVGGFAAELQTMLSNEWDVVGCIAKPGESDVSGDLTVIGFDDEIEKLKEHYRFSDVVIAIGDPAARKRVWMKLKALNFGFPSIVHDSATVYADEIGDGTVIYPNTTIMPRVRLGGFCIINSNVAIGHHTKVADFANINPGASIAGQVDVGSGSTIGIGASIKEHTVVGENTIVGAGACLIADAGPDVTVVGVPARPISE